MNKINLREELLKITNEEKQMEFTIKYLKPVVKKIAGKFSRLFRVSNYDDLVQEANIIICERIIRILKNEKIININGYLLISITNHFSKLLREDKRDKCINNVIEEDEDGEIIGCNNLEYLGDTLINLIEKDKIENIKKFIYSNTNGYALLIIFNCLLCGYEIRDIANKMNVPSQTIHNVINRNLKPLIKKYLGEKK